MGIADSRVRLTGTGGGGGSYGGFRFIGVDIPQGQVIQSARLLIYAAAPIFPVSNIRCYGDDEDNAAAFAVGDLPNARPLTTAFDDSPNSMTPAYGWWLVTATQAVQEIVNRAGWAQGNALALICRSMNAAGYLIQIYSYDANPALAAQLIIDS